MFTPLDDELYPDDCRVVHMPLCNQWIYWIQKNGTSSLMREHLSNNLRLYRNEEIKQLSTIDIYIRDAQSRYVSGVNTFIHFSLKGDPTLDPKTLLWTAKRHKFLNRHFLPQFHWILNLSRYIEKETQLRFHDLNDLKQVTVFNESPAKLSPPSEEFAKELLADDAKMEVWFYIDSILLELCGKSLTWQALVQYYQNNHPNAWEVLTKKFQLLHEQILSAD